MTSRKPSRERTSRGQKRGEKDKGDDKPAFTPSPVPPIAEEPAVEIPPVEEVVEEINPHVINKDLFKDTIENLFSSLHTFQSPLPPTELSLLVDKSPSDNDLSVDYSLMVSKVKFQLENQTSQLKSVEELVKHHMWRTFQEQVVPQQTGEGDIFDANTLVDFDKITEGEGVASVLELSKLPQYSLPLLNQLDKTKEIAPASFVPDDLLMEISQKVYQEKSQEAVPASLSLESSHKGSGKSLAAPMSISKAMAYRPDASFTSGGPVSITKALAARPDASFSSNDFFMAKAPTPKFERSIFYEASESKSVSGDEKVDRGKSMTKDDMWNSPLMSRTQMVLADADRRPWILQPSPLERETDAKILKKMRTAVDFLKNPRILDDSSTSFEITPKLVEFREYEIGSVYTQTLTLRNMTIVGQKLRIIPPSSDDFAISVVKTSKDGLIAPGMKAIYSITFSPKKKGGYTDNVVLVLENATKIAVPISATQPSSALVFPPIFDIGPCLLGDVKLSNFECTNSGNGLGIFCIIPESDFSNEVNYFDESITFVPNESSPFEIIPYKFKLLPGAQVSVKVKFCPFGPPTNYTQRFLILSDGGSSDPFTLKGVSCTPVFEIATISGNDLSAEEKFQTDFILRELLFASLNPATTQTKKVSIKNVTPLEVRYKWNVVIPGIERPDLSHLPGITAPLLEPEPAPTTSTPFTITPEEGTFTPGGVCEFSFTFSPNEINSYSHIAHLIACNLPPICLLQQSKRQEEKLESASSMNGRFKDVEVSEQRVDMTLVEIGMKGCGKMCEVSLLPPSLILPGVCVIGQTYTKTVQLVNSSTSAVRFSFVHLDPRPSHFALNLNPSSGLAPPNSSTKVIIRYTSKILGPFCETVTCEVSNFGVLQFFIQGKAIGARITVDRTTVDFGLVRTGTEATTHVNIRNPFKIPSSWSIHPVDPNADVSKLFISPSSGTLGPMENGIIKIRYQPIELDSLRVGMVLKVKDGEPEYIALRAEAQSPKVCLSNNIFDLMSGFVEIPITRIVYLRNLTRIPTKFAWEEIETEDFSVKCEPSSGEIGPHENLKIQFTFTAHKIPEIVDVETLLCCDVAEMELPIGCIIKVKLEGLSISYSILNSTRPAILTSKSTVLDWVVHALPPPKPFPTDPFQLPSSESSTSLQILSQSSTFSTKYHTSAPPTPTGSTSARPIFTPMAHPASQPALAHVYTTQQRPMTRAATQPVLSLSAAFSTPPIPTQHVTAPSTPITSITTAQVVPVVPTPDPNAIPAISFNTIPIFTQQSTILVFRNNTSMPTRFTFSLKKYNPPIKNDARPGTPDTPGRNGYEPSLSSSPRRPPTGLSMGSSTLTTGSIGGRKSRLSDAEEKSSHFQSQKGKQYEQAINKRKIQAEMQTLAGLAIWVDPESGLLQPYEDINVKVSCYGDMCGKYDDILLFQAAGLAPLLFVVNAEVQGSPLVIWKNSMGLDMYSTPPTIHWAPLPANPKPALSKRIFKLTNGAPFHVQIKWKVYKVVELDGVQEIPATEEHEDEADCPYTVTPKQLVLKAHQTQEFQVQLLCKKVGVYHYRMEPIAFAQGRRVYLRKDSLTDTLVLPASPQLPALPIDLVARAIHSRLDPSRTTLRLQCFITGNLSNQSSNTTRNQSVILTNNTEARMKFTVSTKSPFEIIKMVARRPVDDVDDENGEVPSSEPLALGADGYEVAQKSSVEVYVTFQPPSWLFTVDSYQDRFLEGSIVISFGDGSTQAIAVQTSIIYPQLAATPMVLDFGKVSGRSAQTITLAHTRYHPMLRWSITHIPTVSQRESHGAMTFSSKTSAVPHFSAAQPTKRDTPEFYDLPEVFELSQKEGVLLGGPNVTTSGGAEGNTIHVTFKPEHMVSYRTRYRLCTQVGNSIELEFKGEGGDGS